MKSFFKPALLALSGAAILATSASAAVSLGSGDLAIAFYQVTPGAGGGSVGNNTYVFDLGAASLYRENTLTGVSVSTVNSGIGSSNINADLSAAFGSNWASSGTVRWMVVGNVGQTDPTIGGDTARSSYFSVARNDMNVQSTFPNLSSSNRTGLSNSIETFLDAANKPSGANDSGAIIPTTELKTVDEYMPPAALTYFTIGTNPYQVLANGGVSNGSFTGALDIYRVLHTTSGADLTAGLSGTDATIGQGQYVGTLALDSAGNLSIVPEPSTAVLGLLGVAGACFRRRKA